VKKILLTSLLVIVIFFAYSLYKRYQENIITQSYVGAIEERAMLYSLLILDNKRNTNNAKSYLKSSILFDLRVMNKYGHIGNKVDLKRYCSYIQDIQDDLIDSNLSLKKIFHKVCL